jgi:hypothetical protein
MDNENILDLDGKLINMNWTKAYLLIEKAQNGDEEAQKQLEEMNNTELFGED